VELTTTRLVAGGDALARGADGRVIFVDGALPGERVQVDVTASHTDHQRARVVDVLDASPHRIEPPCAHARAGCGGCGWQHIDVDAQRRFKEDIIRDALRRIARLDRVPLAPTVALAPTGYRTTVRALVVDGQAAFRRHRSHDPITIDSCLVAHPLVDDLLVNGRFGNAREVVVRVGVATGERAVRTDPFPAEIKVPGDVQHTERASVREVIAGITFRVSIRSFWQSRPDGAEALAHLVRDAVGRGRRVADLYCGAGLFSATLDAPGNVVAVERDRHAFADARDNLRAASVRVVRADVAKWRPEAVDVVIADPSRAGLGRAAARVVLGCDAARVVLVSCDAAAMARDIGLLGDGGYDVTSLTPVDLFPHTPHIECVTVLDRVD